MIAYGERNTWSQLIASVLGTAVYLALVIPQLLARPIAEIDWQWPMVWTVVAAIAASVAISVLWGIGAGIADPDEQHTEDIRDRDIARAGGRVGQLFATLGGLGGLVLAMVEADWFWIGNTLFVGFFLATVIGSLVSLVAYRRGLR